MPYNIVLNSNCNLSCKYCFAKEILSSQDFINASEIDYIINFLKNSQRDKISLIGGEPTLHPEIISIIEKLRKEKFTISIKSNGLWDYSLNKYWSEINDKELFFLLNINSPSSYSSKQFETLKINLQYVKNQKLVLSINIDKIDFEYEYILNFAKDNNVKYIRWSFAHPIFERTKKSIDQTFFPIANYSKVSTRIVEFVRKAAKLGIMTLGDHSIIRCMFTDKQHQEIINSMGEINCKCEGTIDIFPDLQVIYCLPTYSLFEKHYLNKFSDMDELEMFFESRINVLRKKALPFDFCKECGFLKINECHGGCLSHRSFSLESLNEFYLDWNCDTLKNIKLTISPNIKLIKKNSGQSSVVSEDFIINVSDFVIEFLNKFKDCNTIDKVILDLDIDLDYYKSEINALISNCQKYNILKCTK